MTLVSNIKWYINWEEWGIAEPSLLLSYNGIINTAYHIVDDCTWDIIFIVDFFIDDNDKISVLDILNKYPLDYYNKFNSEWRIVNRTIEPWWSKPILFYWTACEWDITAVWYLSESNERIIMRW